MLVSSLIWSNYIQVGEAWAFEPYTEDTTPARQQALKDACLKVCLQHDVTVASHRLIPPVNYYHK